MQTMLHLTICHLPGQRRWKKSTLTLSPFRDFEDLLTRFSFQKDRWKAPSGNIFRSWVATRNLLRCLSVFVLWPHNPTLNDISTINAFFYNIRSAIYIPGIKNHAFMYFTLLPWNRLVDQWNGTKLVVLLFERAYFELHRRLDSCRVVIETKPDGSTVPFSLLWLTCLLAMLVDRSFDIKIEDVRDSPSRKY